MRISRLGLTIGLALLLSGVAEAGWFGSGSKHPKPLDPLTRVRGWDTARRTHGTRPNKYTKPGWGAQWKLMLKNHPVRPHPYIRGY